MSGNELWMVTGNGTHSLLLPAKSTEGQQACPSVAFPIVRMFAFANKPTPSSTFEIDVT